MVNLLVLCLCFLSAAVVSLRAQILVSECDIVLASDLSNLTASQDGAIGVFFGGSDAAAGLSTITLENFKILSLAVGTVQNKFRWASVVITYNCSGEGCPDDTYPRTDQFDLQCLNDSGGDPMWLAIYRSDPTNSSLTTNDLRRDCSFCLNPVNATDFGLPDGTTVDADFHCAACDTSCLTGDDGLGYCTGVTAGACCNVYQPNAMGVNICAVNCSDGYEADPPDFICERRCPVLDNPTNGQVSHPTRTFGSVATYTCNGLFELASGDEMRTCQSNSTWDGNAAICSDCPALTDPASGMVSLTGLSTGDVASYTCNSSYFLNGTDVRTCEEMGWSFGAPTCEACSTQHTDCMVCNSTDCIECNPGFEFDGGECIIHCPVLDDPTNGQVSFPNRIVGSVATYNCSTVLVGGDKSRTCQSNGAWDGTAAICSDCPSLSRPVNGMVIVTGLTIGSTAMYTCDSEYALTGIAMRTCQGPTWSSSAPTCEKACPVLVDPPNGEVSHPDRTVGSIAVYTCNATFIFIRGNPMRTCLSNSTWNGTAAACSDCPDLSSPENGKVTIYSFVDNGTTTYTCNSGYFLNGTEVRICEKPEWSLSAPTCESCSTQHSDCVECNSENCTVCDIGFELDDGECERRCPVLDAPISGLVSYPTRAVGSVATYTCNDGFIFVDGDILRTCQSDGTWGGTAAVCSDCPILSDPENGMVNVIGVLIHSTASYSCNIGYILNLLNETAAVVRVCQKPEWIPSAPTCDACSTLYPDCMECNSTVDKCTVCKPGFVFDESGECERQCPALIHPTNGQVNSPSIMVGSVATYTCNTDFLIVSGDIMRTCQNDSTWDGDAAVCADCPLLDNPEHGMVTWNGVSTGSTAVYACYPGYVLNETETRTCEGPEWTLSAPTCNVCSESYSDCMECNSTACTECISGFEINGRECERRCPVLDTTNHGQVSHPNRTVGSLATYTCDNGSNFVFVAGEKVRKCKPDSTWDGEAAVCSDCPILRGPENGKLSVDGLSIGTTVLYECNFGYFLNGTDMRICERTGWSFSAPTCDACNIKFHECLECNSTECTECITITDPENGRVILSGTSVGDTVMYMCKSGYFLNGTESSICQESGWSSDPSTCDACSTKYPDCKKCNRTVCTECDSGFDIQDNICKRTGVSTAEAVGITLSISLVFGCVAGLLLMAIMAKCCCQNMRGKYSTARATDEGALEFESELRPMYDEV